MKTCTVYKTSKNYIITTESLATIGLRIGDDPTYVLSIDSNIDEFRKKMFDSLNSSRVGIYTPKRDEWASWEKEQLLKMGQKSYITLYKISNSCHIILDKNEITIQPYKYCEYNRPRSGLCPVKEAEIKIDAETDKNEIINKIIEVLNVSYK
jgi:hypothetical protein